MVLNNTYKNCYNKNHSILLKILASVFSVSSYFPDNPRAHLTLKLRTFKVKVTDKGPDRKNSSRSIYI